MEVNKMETVFNGDDVNIEVNIVDLDWFDSVTFTVTEKINGEVREKGRIKFYLDHNTTNLINLKNQLLWAFEKVERERAREVNDD
jgi:hypothetical protein